MAVKNLKEILDRAEKSRRSWNRSIRKVHRLNPEVSLSDVEYPLIEPGIFIEMLRYGKYDKDNKGNIKLKWHPHERLREAGHVVFQYLGKSYETTVW